MLAHFIFQAHRNCSGHGPTKILPNILFSAGIRGPGTRLDWGVVQLDRAFGMFGALHLLASSI